MRRRFETIAVLAMLCGVLLPAQQSSTGKKTVARKAAARPARAPLSRADVERLWRNKNEELLLNEIRLRNLAFEPEEDWLAQMAKIAPMPRVVSDLQPRIPPAPDVAEVQAEAPQILANLKTAVQARDEKALALLLHPELLNSKAKVYALFDPANYRDHRLGRFAPAESRRVGMQFFELTTSQVELLDYVLFSTSRGKLVIRDVETGPAVASRFLKDEQELARSKLELVFRAMNDGDDSALRNLCTPGLYDSIKDLAGGARLTRGVRLTLSQINAQISVPLDQKSIRPVALVSFNSPAGRKIEFNVDFERVDNDLRVVRIRDTANKVIAWDPDIDNYLNRRYNLPDGPKISDPPQGRTDLIQFFPLSRIRELAIEALYAGESQKILDFAEEILESQPTGGDGYGLRASANHLLGKYDAVASDVQRAFEGNGTVYFSTLHHRLQTAQEFWPVVLAVSKTKLTYIPLRGSAPEEIDLSQIVDVSFEGGANGAENKSGGFKRMLHSATSAFKGQRPFLSLKFHRAGRDVTYNFAAVGTTCGGATQGGEHLALGADTCSGGQIIVPKNWDTNLAQIQRAIDNARQGSGVARH